MRTLFLIIAALLALGVLTGSAQSDSLRNEPQIGDEHMNSDQPHLYKDDQQAISHKALPTSIRKTLEQGDRYKGWEDGFWYRDNSSGLYVLDFGSEGNKRLYRFDENGNPVSGQVSVKDKKKQNK